MTRKELYQNHKSCMAANAALLVADLCCVLLSARCLSSFIALFSDFSYEKGLEILGWLGMVSSVQLLCAYVKGRCFMPARDAGTNRLECTLYARYLESPVRPDSQARLSVICEKDIPECVGFFTEKLPAAIQAIAGIAACTLMLAGKEKGIWAAALLLALGMIQFLPPFITEKYLIQNYVRAGQAEEGVRQELISGLSGILTIKMLNLHDWFLERYLQRQREFSKIGERAAGTSSIQTALYSGATLVQQLGFLLIGAMWAAGGGCSVEILAEGYALSFSFYQYMARLGSLRADRGTCRAAESRILGLFQEQAPSLPFFQSLELDLPGKGLWLVKGSNGAGKSTLFSILNGSCQSDAQITQDGKPFPREARLAQISWCPQERLHISDSFRGLMELIPEETIDNRKLQLCLSRFGIDSGLLEKPLDRLSGGQQKQLTLALSLAKRSHTLLLDEPEASLDQPAVQTLKRLLEQESRPVLLVTHSPVFDHMADGSIYIEGGTLHVQRN